MSGEISIENIHLSTRGIHNVLNSLAAITIGLELNFGAKILQSGFNNFKGVKRRFTEILDLGNTKIIDDYAHHPKEIDVTIKTALEVAKNYGGYVTVIFQPHRFSRLELLFNDFVKSLMKADFIYCTDVYAAGEKETTINSKNLIHTLQKNNKKALLARNFEDVKQLFITKQLKPGIILFMGAGSISNWAYKIVDIIK